MLKNSLFQPSLSFSFSAAPFFFLSVSAFFFLSASAPLFFSSFCFCFQHHSFGEVQPPSFVSFQLTCALFFSPKTFFFFSPKCFALLSLASFFSSFFSPYIFKGQPKTCCSPKISLQPKHVALLSWSQMACLKTKRDPLFMPILKPKIYIYIPSASIYPKPNILSSCFVSFIWINLHFLQICNKI